MSSKRKKGTFEQPETEDLYDESLEEHVEMDKDLEKELDVLDHLYRMSDPQLRVKKYQYYLQSKHREADEVSVPKKEEPKIEKYLKPIQKPKSVTFTEVSNTRDLDLIHWVKNEDIEVLKSDTQYKEGTSHVKLALDGLLNFPMTITEIDVEMKKLALSKGDEIQRQDIVFLFYNTKTTITVIMKNESVLNYWIKPKE